MPLQSLAVLLTPRSVLQLWAAVFLTVAVFLVLPATSLLQGLLPDDPVIRRFPAHGRVRCHVPLLSDAALEASLSSGVRGRYAAALREQLRLWHHQELRRPEGPGEKTETTGSVRPWRSVGRVMASHWPVSPRWPVTSTFGDRVHPMTGRWRFHSGVDIGVPTGTDIRAALPGQVRCACDDDVNGRYVVLDHGDGLRSYYAHLKGATVAVGQWVERGQEIGRMGSTGNSTGPHVHFEIRQNGVRIDPLTYLPPGP